MILKKTLVSILILCAFGEIHASGSGGYGAFYASLQGTYGKSNPVFSNSESYGTLRGTGTIAALLFNIGVDLQVPTATNTLAPSHSEIAHVALGFGFGKILWLQWLNSGHIRTTFNWFHWAADRYDMLPEKRFFPDSIGISISYDHPWRAEEVSRVNIGIALAL